MALVDTSDVIRRASALPGRSSFARMSCVNLVRVKFLWCRARPNALCAGHTAHERSGGRISFDVEDGAVFYPAIVTPDNGAFVVTFPDAPGCVTQVGRVDDLLPLATEALAGWLEATLDAGDVVSPPAASRRAPRGSRSILVPVLPTAIAVRVLMRRARAEQGLTRDKE